MLFLMFLLLFTKPTWSVQSVGSVLFYKRNPAECWTQDELAKLRARKIFESIVVPCLPPDKITAKYNRQVLRYFRDALRAVDNKNDGHNSEILKQALADTIGGYLRGDFLPNSRFAFYAGYIPYSSAQRMHEFYDLMKSSYLNTQGLGWKVPDHIPLQSNLTVGKILIGPGKPFDPCEGLVIRRDENNCIRIPLPKVENIFMPGALALPFKTGGFVSLTAPSSENILLKYYATGARCILQSSPAECRHTDFVNFNNELWHWMKQHVAAHLMDEQLYAAYGGVLRIAAAVQNYGKGLSRRNLYDDEEQDITKYNKWDTFKHFLVQTINFDADWTPPVALILILGTAVAICCLHIVYTYVLGHAGGCHCLNLRSMSQVQQSSMPPSSLPQSSRPSLLTPPAPSLTSPPVRHVQLQDMKYSNIDSSFPAVLPSHSGPKFCDGSQRGYRTLGRTKCESVGTQGTYDYDNTEKMMSIMISDDNVYEMYSSTEATEEDAGATGAATTIVGSVRTVTAKSRQRTPRSPPKIEASVAQLKINKRSKSPRGQPRRSKQHQYSTTTVTHSEATYRREGSDTGWTDSGSSDRSVSSVSSKSLSQSQSQSLSTQRRTRRDRDLSWARRVVSKQNLSNQSQTLPSSGTFASYTTPPSKR